MENNLCWKLMSYVSLGWRVIITAYIIRMQRSATSHTKTQNKDPHMIQILGRQLMRRLRYPQC